MGVSLGSGVLHSSGMASGTGVREIGVASESGEASGSGVWHFGVTSGSGEWHSGVVSDSGALWSSVASRGQGERASPGSGVEEGVHGGRVERQSGREARRSSLAASPPPSPPPPSSGELRQRRAPCEDSMAAAGSPHAAPDPPFTWFLPVSSERQTNSTDSIGRTYMLQVLARPAALPRHMYGTGASGVSLLQQVLR